MKICDIETPALIVDKRVLAQNIRAMEKLLAGSNLRLRPHYKSHKCSALAHLQMHCGAVGITCAKLCEAEDLCDSGIENILIANQIVEKTKIRRLADLARKCYLTVCVDNEENIDELDRAAGHAGTTVHCYIEYEIGMNRCGVCEDARVLELAKYIQTKKYLTFDGLQAYAGHISHIVDERKRQSATEENAAKIKKLIVYLQENGVTVGALSGGSTGTSAMKAMENLYTELQAGSYLFMDATYAQLDVPFKNSLFLLTTVVSTRENLAVVDSGVKTCGVDQGMPSPLDFTVSKIVDSEEHFQLHCPSKQLRVGEKILLTPAHCCSTVNLHDRIYVVEGDKVVDRLLITARGCGK